MRVARIVMGAAAAMVVAGAAAPVRAQGNGKKKCKVLCAPSFAFNPGFVRSHLFKHPRFIKLSDGTTHELPSTTELQLQFGVTVPTTIPRTTLYAKFQWFPTASRANNPFTAYTAHELGDSIKANSPSVTAGAAFDVVSPKETSGWLDLAAYIGDLYSEAARPVDRSAYTHKLDLGTNLAILPFSWMPKDEWLHGVSVNSTLDFVASGLPKRGDEVPAGERRFTEDARAFSLIVWLSFPIAPLHPGS